MQLIKKQERLGELAFGLAMLIHLVVMVTGYGEWDIPLRGRLLQAAFVFFCIKILLTCYSKKQWIFMVVTGAVGSVSYLFTKDEYVVSVIVMLFAAVGTDMRRWCKYILFTALAITIVTAMLSLFGIGGIPVDIRDYGRGGEEARWCLGFGHANNFHGTVWYLIALSVYLYFEKMDWRHYLLLTFGNFILFYFTISKGGLIAVQILLTAACLLRYWNGLEQRTWIYICGIFAVIGVFAVSMFSVSIKWKKSEILMFLDRIFTGRINLAYQHANISKWKWLSRAGELGVVDNGWVTIFFNYGYVIGFLFVLFHLYLIYKVWMEKKALLLILIVTCVFYTFMEATYTINNAYLLSNISYLAAMILMAAKEEPENEPKQIKA